MKNLNCFGALTFLRLEEEELEKSFFNHFRWSEFWSRTWNAWKFLEWFGCWAKLKSAAKKEWFFVHSAILERARNWEVKKFSVIEQNFVFTYGFLQLFFIFRFRSLIMILYFFKDCFDVGVCWSLVFNMNFI